MAPVLAGRRHASTALPAARRQRAFPSPVSYTHLGTLAPIGALSEAESDAIGRYRDAYAVITDFQDSLAKAAASLRPVLAAERIQSVDDIVRRRQALADARATLADSARRLQVAQALSLIHI